MHGYAFYMGITRLVYICQAGSPHAPRLPSSGQVAWCAASTPRFEVPLSTVWICRGSGVFWKRFVCLFYFHSLPGQGLGQERRLPTPI